MFLQSSVHTGFLKLMTMIIIIHTHSPDNSAYIECVIYSGCELPQMHFVTSDVVYNSLLSCTLRKYYYCSTIVNIHFMSVVYIALTTPHTCTCMMWCVVVYCATLYTHVRVVWCGLECVVWYICMLSCAVGVVWWGVGMCVL